MKRLTVALASALLVSGVYAQTASAPTAMAPAAGAMTATPSKADARRDKAVEAHIRELHQKLAVTAAEEPKWDLVAKAMRDSAAETDAAIDKREGLVRTATAVDNLGSYADIAQAHVDGVKRLAAAFAPLYAAMPDAQKKVADAVFAHRTQTGKKAAK